MAATSGSSVGSDLEYWSSWQVLVCAFIILLPTCISIRFTIRHREEQDGFDFDGLWRPSWRSIHPLCLLLYRLTAFLFMACLLSLMLLLVGPFAFYFYTQWTLALVTLYFAVGTVISFQGCLLSSKKRGIHKSASTNTSTTNMPTPSHVDELILKPCFLGNLMQIIYQTSAGASMLTDLVFWCVLVPTMAGKEFELTLLFGSVHSANVLFLIVDSFLNALSFEWFGFNYFILWTATYATFLWIVHACSSSAWWPYPFLELSTPWAPLWYFGLAVIHVPCYGVYILLVKAKNSTCSKVFPRAFVRSHKQAAQYKKVE